MDISTGIAALIGTIFGGGISILGTWIQQKQSNQRDYVKIAADLALKEFDLLTKTKSRVNPLESFVTYYVKYISLIKGGKITIDDLRELRKFNKELSDFYNSPEANIHYQHPTS